MQMLPKALVAAATSLVLFSGPALAQTEASEAAPSALETPQADLVETASLTLTIENIASIEGNLMIQVMAEDSFENRDPVARAIVEVTSNPQTTVIEDLPPGEYAVMLIHDENGNGEMERNMMGIPREPMAFSNGARIRFGPPSFEAMKFDVVAGENAHTLAFN